MQVEFFFSFKDTVIPALMFNHSATEKKKKKELKYGPIRNEQSNIESKTN